jgi:hypothetical protein
MTKQAIVSASVEQAERNMAGAAVATKVSRKPTYRPKRASAGPCPRVTSHVNTRIYKTAGTTRYCVCDDCGETWKQTGQAADELSEYAVRVAASLDQADRIETEDGTKVIVIDDATARDMATDFRRLAVQ